jgi:hypothetical protein
MFPERERIFDWRIKPMKMRMEQRGMPKPKRSKDSTMHAVETRFDPVAAALKQLHDTVAAEPVPEDFLRILDQIDAKIAAAKQVP